VARLCPAGDGCNYCNRVRQRFVDQCECDGTSPHDLSTDAEVDADDWWADLPPGDPPDDDDGGPAPEPPTPAEVEVNFPGVDDMPKRWKKIGVELEGGWEKYESSLRTMAGRFGANFHYDGSVSTGATTSAEISTKPYERLGSLLNCVDALYPDEVNSSCGMHVHVSFDELDYGHLMSERFYFYFLLRWEAWGKRLNIRSSEFWSRLRGENQYCKREWKSVEQVTLRGRDGVRYAHLNFCYSLHGTVECRLLPMFKDKTIAAKAIQELLSIYSDYLATCSTEDEEHAVTVAEAADDTVTEVLDFEVDLDLSDYVEVMDREIPVFPTLMEPVPSNVARMYFIGDNNRALMHRLRSQFGSDSGLQNAANVLATMRNGE
jgi:hypothetical protein